GPERQGRDRDGRPTERGAAQPRTGRPSRSRYGGGPRDGDEGGHDHRSTRSERPERSYRRSERSEEGGRHARNDRYERSARPSRGPAGPGRGGPDDRRPASRGPRRAADARYDRRDRPPVRRVAADDPGARQPFRKGERSNRFALPNPANEGLIRLNRYLAQAGVGSRREADALIASGAVTVNGQVVTALGTKVRPEDKVHFGGQRLSMEKKRYVLLNKPKDFITTTDDPQERRTVMSLVAAACTERLYPVGRLDRNTTGVLLLTNDGDLAKRLTHPGHGAEKLYHATLDKAVTKGDLERLVSGVDLDDGPAHAVEASFVDDAGKREVGLKLHMGRNRVVRRMFEALGYEVVKLDRVMFAGLTKKDLPRGHWRHLSDKEVTLLARQHAATKPRPSGAPSRSPRDPDAPPPRRPRRN
ncbi:MAG: RNA-binding S4 domain-containing protein, partial [Flavobacteriales bacterium]|nr:RNA-binding S4 domain-containing protein [Flavobacteriales bacterium]